MADLPDSPEFPEDIYTEPEPDPHTLANLGPLTGLAGLWIGTSGHDVSPKLEGPEAETFIEHAEFQPIDAQTNGPQIFYGLRYHLRIVKPDDVETFHDQVGYWLWEPATGALVQTLSIPRGLTAMATGRAKASDRSFRLDAVRGGETNGILANPFLEHAFKTLRYSIAVTIHDERSWSYEQETVLSVRGQAEPFSHTDRNLLRKVGEPTPNPTALAAMAEAAGKSAIDVASASVDSRGKAGLSGASTG
ncbi:MULTISPECIES: FABP family protein [Variovorax]|jgi:hypothetical protein|uniref:FABP family protein n=1 Tax=Variovorax TaxID=34072 RepID=UPI00086EB2A2|nr:MULTISPECIES: heme-binding beta-barrel domain-containing protein [Variovorax]MBN8753234.1 FABP family protein [Variovorax sp.]ODU11496.1 MAG: hypothetical protein ABS94_32520 [Variovorax sp. SCN 67-85]ODV27317.1 MAG: hypothetical protein ABT25_00155 [Variovorax sp. SCN 67-20]OJZ11960.1 MAG: FABP family protein [Variovorax sp. 67-131]UKI05431.1 heme-binding beta-barrel domain-containing protein [Variovorax paradoxus]